MLWSKAAAETAGAGIAPLQAKFVTEASEIVPKAKDWFHVLDDEQEGGRFLGHGRELTGTWNIFVQLGTRLPMDSLSDGHFDPDHRETVFKTSEALDDPDNEVFADFRDLVS